MTQTPEDPRETETWEEKKRRSAGSPPPPETRPPTAATPAGSESWGVDAPSTLPPSIHTVGQQPEDPAETARWERKKGGSGQSDGPAERRRFWPFGRRSDRG